MRKVLAIAAAALMAIGLAACGDDDDDDGGATATTEAESAETVSISAKEYAFTVPDEIEGGIVEVSFKNDGKLMHNAEFLSFGDTPLAEALDAFEKACCTDEEGGPIASSIKPFGGGTDTDAGESSSSTIRLPAGKYYVVCTLSDTDSLPEDQQEQAPEVPPHFRQGMAKEITVTGDADPGLPEGDAVVEAFDYGFRVPALEAGEQTIVLHNTSTKQIHLAVLFKLAAGKTVDDLKAAFAEEEGEEPEGPPPFEEAGFSAVLGESNASTFEVDLEAGDYAAVCFIQDRAGGPPHFAPPNNMITPFTVAA